MNRTGILFYILLRVWHVFVCCADYHTFGDMVIFMLAWDWQLDYYTISHVIAMILLDLKIDSNEA